MPKAHPASVGVLALLLIGLNLRAGITSASALLHELQVTLGYGPLVASIIPSIPTMCFAMAGAGTSWLTGKLGVKKAILLSLGMLTAGLAVRGVPATGALVAGTVLGMSGMAVCNVAVPSFIREQFAQRTYMMTGLYTVSMTVGATTAAVAVIPLAQALSSPSAAVGTTGLLAAAAFLAFLPVARYAGHDNTQSSSRPISPWPLLHTPKGLLLTALFTIQALIAFALLSWFPFMLTNMGLSASESGLMYGLMQLVTVPAGMILIAIGSRPGMLRPAFYLAGVAMAIGVASLLVVPVWMAAVPAVLLGFGLCIFPLVMVVISRSGESTAETTALSTLAQSAGYLFATAGPFCTGLLHSATGSWTLPLALLLILALTQILLGHLITGHKAKTH